MTRVSWLRGSIDRVNLESLRDHARASILDVNDGITSAAGIAEGFISAGAPTRTLLLAGTAVILAGGSAAAGGPLQRGADRVGDGPCAARSGAGEH